MISTDLSNYLKNKAFNPVYGNLPALDVVKWIDMWTFNYYDQNKSGDAFPRFLHDGSLNDMTLEDLSRIQRILTFHVIDMQSRNADLAAMAILGILFSDKKSTSTLEFIRSDLELKFFFDLKNNSILANNLLRE